VPEEVARGRKTGWDRVVLLGWGVARGGGDGPFPRTRLASEVLACVEWACLPGEGGLGRGTGWSERQLAALSAYGLTRLFPDPITPNVYRPLAAWTQAEGLAERELRVEASDIGAIGYYSGALVLDSEGLVWPQARSYGGQLALIEAERPEYVLMVAERWRMQRFSASPVYAEYEPVARFNAALDRELRPDPQALREGWSQDYLIFRRRDVAPGDGG